MITHNLFKIYEKQQESIVESKFIYLYLWIDARKGGINSNGVKS